MEEEDVCPICFEEYKNPKLLPCRHSFCANCLRSLVLANSEKSQFLCPNCRFKVSLPPGGVDALLSNYFIRSSPEPTDCEFCGCECKGKRLTCEKCMRRTCPSCFISHGENRECNKLDETPERPGDLYRALRSSSRKSIDTVYEAALSTSFQCDQVGQLVQLVPSSFAEKIWIANNNSHELAEYDRSGKKLKSISIKEIIVDICTHTGNTLLVTCTNSQTVMKLSTREESIFICQTIGYPKYITCMNEGMVAVATTFTNNILDEFRLFYYKSNGEKLDDFRVKPFKHISGLCFNKAVNQVCVSDREHGRLFMVASDGKHYTYFGSRRLTHGRRRRRRMGNPSLNFIPLGITCDSDGNTFIFDDHSGLIHIVDQRAKLVALMDTIEDRYVDANYMAFNRTGQLWISDTQEGKIKIYNVERCVNYLGEGSDRLVAAETDDDDDDENSHSITVNGNELQAGLLAAMMNSGIGNGNRTELLEHMRNLAMMNSGIGNDNRTELLEHMRNFAMMQGDQDNGMSEFLRRFGPVNNN